MHRFVSPRRFLLLAGLAALASFAIVWAWVAAMPLAYLDPEYPSWLAKREMLRRCDLGEVVVVGDSRAAADVIPALLPMKTTNLAVGGGKSIEAYTALTRSLRCNVPLRRIIISLDSEHFMQPDLFWERTVRFGFLDRSDVAALERVARDLGDWNSFQARQTDHLPDRFRGPLYALRFPPLYFNSVIKGGVFLRWWQNRRSLQASLDARGQYFFGTDAGSSDLAAEAHLERFRPMPVLDWYFDRMLALLAERGIPVDFVSMPLNEATWYAVRPAFREAFAAYLAFYAMRYPNFHVVGPTMPRWPDRLFGDAFSHLNPEGAARFSAMLGRCLDQRMSGITAPAACQSEAFLLAAQSR
jgi:hypothetical protein